MANMTTEYNLLWFNFIFILSFFYLNPNELKMIKESRENLEAKVFPGKIIQKQDVTAYMILWALKPLH